MQVFYQATYSKACRVFIDRRVQKLIVTVESKWRAQSRAAAPAHAEETM